MGAIEACSLKYTGLRRTLRVGMKPLLFGLFVFPVVFAGCTGENLHSKRAVNSDPSSKRGLALDSGISNRRNPNALQTADTAPRYNAEINWTFQGSTHRFAEMILVDSIRSMDDDHTFAVMDSMCASARNDKLFYFRTFRKIADYADGALAEVVGSYIMSFAKCHPEELAEHLAKVSSSERESWAFYVAEEVFYMVENKEIPGITSWMDRIIDQCSACTSAQKKALEDFNQVVVEQSKLYAEDNQQ